MVKTHEREKIGFNAPHGEKMITMKLKFWTNNIPLDNPKMAWCSGVVHLVANRSRGLGRDTGTNPIPFNQLEEVTGDTGKIGIVEAIIQALEREHVILVESHKTSKHKPEDLKIKDLSKFIHKKT